MQGFSDVNFSLDHGQLMALVGPSGSGKSSVLKTIFRTYLPSRGSIAFRCKDDITDLATCDTTTVLQLRRNKIGFVTQFLKVLPRVSALHCVAAPLIETGFNPNDATARAAELLHFLGIREELFNISPLTFSGGEQQRVNIARGVIAPRELLLLDEPTASLDKEASDKVLQLLDELKKEGVAVIAIFHDMAKVKQVADLTCRLECGGHA